MKKTLKYCWLDMIRSEAGPASTTRLVLFALSFHMNIDGTSCYPSISLLSNETGLSKRVVGFHLENATQEGWLKREYRKSSGQAWRQYIYYPVIPKAGYGESLPQAENVVTESNHVDKKGSYSGAEGGYSHDEKVVTQGNTSIPSYSNTESISISLAEKLFFFLKKRRPSIKKPNIKSWYVEIEKMIEIEKRDPVEIEKVIVWSQDDQFWQNRIIDPQKLRKHFDQLSLIMQSKNSEKCQSPGFGTCPQCRRQHIDLDDNGLCRDCSNKNFEHSSKNARN